MKYLKLWKHNFFQIWVIVNRLFCSHRRKEINLLTNYLRHLYKHNFNNYTISSILSAVEIIFPLPSGMSQLLLSGLNLLKNVRFIYLDFSGNKKYFVSQILKYFLKINLLLSFYLQFEVLILIATFFRLILVIVRRYNICFLLTQLRPV